MPELGLFSNPYLLAAIVGSALLQVATVTVPGLRHFFGVDQLPTWDWWLIMTLALIPVTVLEVSKLGRAWFLALGLHHTVVSEESSNSIGR